MELILGSLAVIFVLPVFLLAVATPAAKFAVSSSAFGDGKAIPTRHATKGVSGGQNVSPPLSWANSARRYQVAGCCLHRPASRCQQLDSLAGHQHSHQC